MIESWRDDDLREFFLNDRRYKRLPTELESRLFRKLQMLDDATADADLRSPPSNYFEKLSGTLKGMHSLRVNGQWRLIFAWDGSLKPQIFTSTPTRTARTRRRARADDTTEAGWSR